MITKPLQFFLSGNATSKISFTKKFKTTLKRLNLKSTAPVFIHAPYVLNFSYPGKSERKEDEEIKKELGTNAYGSWTFYCLKKLLEFGHETGVRGIVIHVGKCCGNDYKTSKDNMFQAIVDCAIYATEQCPILIETPAKQCGEVLNDPEEMADFYSLLPDDVKKVVGIVIDSCHVHSAGHDPVEYLQIMEKRNIPIHLVHYNDSKVMKGACKDRHAPIGKGYIGLQSLYDVLNYCIKKNIPMLTE
jgi:deoxyribonuclease-4